MIDHMSERRGVPFVVDYPNGGAVTSAIGATANKKYLSAEWNISLVMTRQEHAPLSLCF